MAINWASASNGGVATVSSYYSEAYNSACINNGYRHTNNNWGGGAILGSGWNAGSGPPAWAKILFDSVHPINLINVFKMKAGINFNVDPTFGETSTLAENPKDFVLQYLDSSDVWHDVDTVTNDNNVWYQKSFSTVNAKGIRINISATWGGWVCLTELEAWGEITDTTKPSDVTNLTATKVSNSRIDIDSDAATDNIAVAGYQTQVSSDGGTTWNTLSSTAKSFSFVSGNAYFPNVPGVYSLTFRRKAFDTASTPNYSNNWSNIPTAVSITVPVTPPVANFTIEPNTIVTGGTVVLTDTSTNSPTSRQWKLDGTNISTSNPYSLNTTGLSLGTHTIRLDVSNTGGSDDETHTFEVVAAIIVPESRWSKLNLVPLKDSLFWNALDVAEDATEIGDFSGNDNKLAVASSAPVLQTNVINGKPGVYFDGTKNPLNFTTDLTLKHLFLVAKFDGATFTGNEGLLSGVAATSILRGNGNTTTKFANLAIGSGFVYKKNYVALTESTQNAPMNSFAILELIFPSGISLDGIQIGQDTTNTGRKWKGWFIEQIGYGKVQDDCNRRSIYEYFALKFWLWRYKSDNYPYFPFVFNRSSKHRSTELAEISEAEGLRGSDRVVRYLDDAPLHSYDLEFNYRFYLEYLATVQFLNERRLHLPFWIEDIERTFERRMTRTTELTDNGYGSAYKFDYNFGVKDY